MPFIHIKSLPFEEQVEMASIITYVATDFSDKTKIELEHIHTTWEFYRPGHYAKGGLAADYQPENNYPIIVDLLTPDFNDLKVIAVMLESIASSISKSVNFPIKNIFINHRPALSGMVFDDGKVVKW